MNLDLVVEFLTDKSPSQSFDIKEDLERCESLLDGRRKSDVEQVTEGTKLLFESSAQLPVEHSAKRPSGSDEHQIPNDVFLHLDEGVVHGVFVAQIQLAVLLKLVKECIEDGEELNCQRLHVPQLAVLNHGLIVQLVHELKHEFLGAHLHVISVHMELSEEVFMLFLN